VKLLRLIELLNETYSVVQVGKFLSDVLPFKNGLKQGDALSPLLFNCAFEYAIRRLQENQDGLKLNGTIELVVYADDVNMLGGSLHTIKKNKKTLVFSSKETGLEVNVEKTKYMVNSRDQNAGRNHSMHKINSLKGWNNSDI
jgi:hypothetical protein